MLRKLKLYLTNGKKLSNLLSLISFHSRIILYFKFKFLIKSLKNGFKTKAILFYPQKPSDRTVIYKICNLLGYKITNNPCKLFNLAVGWEDTTFRSPNETLTQINKKKPVLNFGCKDISKTKIGLIFKNVFKYPLSINPKRYHGECVRKSDQNAKKDGRIIKCPVLKKEKEFIYEILIDSQNKKGFLVDMRVPIFKNKIPFVYLRFKSSKERFLDSKNPKVKIAETGKVFSKGEIEKIILFCKKLGLDYGELDVLRNKSNKKIYIVDANTTPFGPHKLPRKITKQALEKLAKAFEETFMKPQKGI